MFFSKIILSSFKESFICSALKLCFHKIKIRTKKAFKTEDPTK